MPNTIVPMPDTPSNPSPALLPKVEQWSYAEQANASPPSYPLEDFPAAFEYVAGEHTPRFLSWADQGNIVGIRTPWPEDAIALGRGYAARPHGLRGATLRTSTVLREAARMAEVLEKLKGAKTYTTFTLFIKSEHVGDVRTRELNHLRDQKNTFLEDAKIKFDNKLVNQIFFRVKDGTGDTFCQWVLDQFGAVLATPGIADGLSGDKAAAFKAELSKGQASFAKKYPPNTNAVAVHDSLKGLVGWWCAVEFSAKKGNVTITATGRIPLGVATITDAQPPLTVAEAIAAAGAQAPKGASLLERACTEGYHVYVLNSNESNEAIEASAPAIAEQTRADMINHKSATYWLNLHFNRGEKAARSVFVEFDDNDLKFLDDPQGDKPYDCGAIIFTPPWPVTRGPKSNYSVHVLRSELEKKASLERYFKPAGQTNKLEFWLKSRENAVRTLNWLATKAYNTVENRSFTQIIKSQWGHFSNEFNVWDLGKKVAVSAAGAGVVVGITVLTGGAAMAVIIAGLVVAGVQIPVIAKIEKPKVGGKAAADWFAFDEASGRLYPTQVVAHDQAKIDAAINTFVGNGGAVSADDPTIDDAALLDDIDDDDDDANNDADGKGDSASKKGDERNAAKLLRRAYVHFALAGKRWSKLDKNNPTDNRAQLFGEAIHHIEKGWRYLAPSVMFISTAYDLYVLAINEWSAFFPKYEAALLQRCYELQAEMKGGDLFDEDALITELKSQISSITDNAATLKQDWMPAVKNPPNVQGRISSKRGQTVDPKQQLFARYRFLGASVAPTASEKVGTAELKRRSEFDRVVQALNKRVDAGSQLFLRPALPAKVRQEKEKADNPGRPRRIAHTIRNYLERTTGSENGLDAFSTVATFGIVFLPVAAITKAVALPVGRLGKGLVSATTSLLKTLCETAIKAVVVDPAPLVLPTDATPLAADESKSASPDGSNTMISLRDGAMAGAALLWKISFRMARAQDAISILNGLPDIKTAASADKSYYNGLLTHAKAAYEYHHHLAKLEFYSLGLMSYLSNIMDFAERMQAELINLLAKEPQDKI